MDSTLLPAVKCKGDKRMAARDNAGAGMRAAGVLGI